MQTDVHAATDAVAIPNLTHEMSPAICVELGRRQCVLWHVTHTVCVSDTIRKKEYRRENTHLYFYSAHSATDTAK